MTEQPLTTILTMEEVWQKYKYLGKTGKYELFKDDKKTYFFEDLDEFYILRGYANITHNIFTQQNEGTL